MTVTEFPSYAGGGTRAHCMVSWFLVLAFSSCVINPLGVKAGVQMAGVKRMLGAITQY